MPQLVQYLDKIARIKGRDVLFIGLKKDRERIVSLFGTEPTPEWEEVEQWLRENKIPHEACAPPASDGCLIEPIGLIIYVDVPWDETLPEYQKLRDYLENPDGSFRIKGIGWYCYTLESAMKKKHHDEPGYWEKLLEDF